ncbi:hypothetical protein SLEP1_g52007 [Rubroshorea leprosula]|uniref:Tocopherol cyclase n=1 Tax=Rubroshorea leprosula TaxID=152421 RepID=A0AAV5M561_9ROSI|nr:hypothetical protein SLEP1_g52007 [Rubroshorea leprosula]
MVSLKLWSSVIPSSASKSESKVSVNPVYVPTPHNSLTMPESERRQSFCFMYAVENPAFKRKLTPLEVAQYGPRFTGVGTQILGADDKYIGQCYEESQNFWGSRHELALGNTFIAKKGMQPPSKDVPPQEFNSKVLEGFQVTPLWHQGFMRDDGRTTFLETVKTARWENRTRPIHGWGNVGSRQKSTAGWLAAVPIFESHWQICMARGLSTGTFQSHYAMKMIQLVASTILPFPFNFLLSCHILTDLIWIEWDGERFEFQDAPSYSEKNWVGAFPRKWFWVQSNVFEGASGEVALTAAGGWSQLPGLTETFEKTALIEVHYGGIFYEFVPWNGVLNWEVAPWGYWYMAAENETHMIYFIDSEQVELEARATDPGTTLRAPTSEAGFAPACKDTCFGDLRMQIWDRRSDGNKGKLILDVTSNMAAVEVGGGPWFDTWKGSTLTPELIKFALQVSVDVGGILGTIPLLRPPGF